MGMKGTLAHGLVVEFSGIWSCHAGRLKWFRSSSLPVSGRMIWSGMIIEIRYYQNTLSFIATMQGSSAIWSLIRLCWVLSPLSED